MPATGDAQSEFVELSVIKIVHGISILPSSELSLFHISLKIYQMFHNPNLSAAYFTFIKAIAAGDAACFILGFGLYSAEKNVKMAAETITAASYLQSNRWMCAWVVKLYLVLLILQLCLGSVTVLHLFMINQLLSYLRPTEHSLYLSAAPIDCGPGLTQLVIFLSPCRGHLQLLPVWIGSRAESSPRGAPGELLLVWNLATIIMHLQV